MTTRKIPKRISTALINSLSAGVVPRIGLEYIAVGRKGEIEAVLQDLENVSHGGAAFRFLIGRYGSGKSFMLQLIRNYAMERNFVVADADLDPTRRLTGTNGAGLATYRELMSNLSTKTRPEGSALKAIFEKWISGIQTQTVTETGLKPTDPEFNAAVEKRIHEVVGNMEGMVHGFDFASVLTTYWQGYRREDETQQDAALRWLRGEFAVKTEARNALGVRVIVNDDDWYDYIKLMAHFVSQIGYKGLVVLIDEAVNLYKISNSVARQNNYEKLLAMFNDTLQGKATHLAMLIGGTPAFLEDTRRGLFSYEALKSRLETSRFSRQEYKDFSGPIIRLDALSHTEVYVLLTYLVNVFEAQYQVQDSASESDIQLFLQEVLHRLGADDLLTPREVVRDFLSVLNIVRQNPELTFAQVVKGTDFQPTKPGADPDLAASQFAEFDL
ncbi:MAG: ATP-binding protein [Chloroflexi bacterium]|nr:ATP-binding protein [Chloroflexota bacterium]MBP8060045.1 ATP-binding protein [Chloroflexota bacterium]